MGDIYLFYDDLRFTLAELMNLPFETFQEQAALSRYGRRFRVVYAIGASTTAGWYLL